MRPRNCDFHIPESRRSIPSHRRGSWPCDSRRLAITKGLVPGKARFAIIRRVRASHPAATSCPNRPVARNSSVLIRVIRGSKMRFIGVQTNLMSTREASSLPLLTLKFTGPPPKRPPLSKRGIRVSRATLCSSFQDQPTKTIEMKMAKATNTTSNDAASFFSSSKSLCGTAHIRPKTMKSRRIRLTLRTRCSSKSSAKCGTVGWFDVRASIRHGNESSGVADMLVDNCCDPESDCLELRQDWAKAIEAMQPAS